MKCCICGNEIDGLGNNPAPILDTHNDTEMKLRCCRECNDSLVIPIRLLRIQHGQNPYAFGETLEEARASQV